MYPELFTLSLPIFGEITITSFGVMMALAFLSAYMVVRAELDRLGGDPNLAADMLMGALIGGIVGAKLYYVLLYWDRTVLNPLGMLFSRGGLVWYGGLIGGVLGASWMVRRRRASIPMAADAMGPAMALGYAIGRIGCFLVGDDYGRPTDSWVGIAFPRGVPPTSAANLRRFGANVDPGIPDPEILTVHPTQLYETGVSLVIFFLLWRFRRHPHAQGWLWAVWLAAAGAERFFVEMFRAKDDRFLGAFTLAQLISIGLIVLGLVLAQRFRRASTTEA